MDEASQTPPTTRETSQTPFTTGEASYTPCIEGEACHTPCTEGEASHTPCTEGEASPTPPTTGEGPQKLSTPLPTDWSLCALCQEKRKEKLQCPANAKQKGQGSTYVTLAKNLTRFHELGFLSSDFLHRLCEGENLEETFMNRRACFHLSCRLMYNSTKLKRKAASTGGDNEVNEHARKFMRSESNASFTSEEESEFCCFLCNENAAAQDLRSASTFQLDKKIRNCALSLQDSELLAKLSAGDVISLELKYHPACLCRLYRKAKPKLDCDKPEKNKGVMVLCLLS